MNNISYSNMPVKKMNRTKMTVNAEVRRIRLCKDCIHYSEKDDTCKALRLINHITNDVSNIKSLYCRTREDLCGMDAKYYESKYYSLKTRFVGVKTINDDIVGDHYEIAYSADGSSGICGEGCDIDVYYHNIRLDYVDVY